MSNLYIFGHPYWKIESLGNPRRYFLTMYHCCHHHLQTRHLQRRRSYYPNDTGLWKMEDVKVSIMSMLQQYPWKTLNVNERRHDSIGNVFQIGRLNMIHGICNIYIHIMLDHYKLFFTSLKEKKTTCNYFKN